jgi:hypothetical protein
MLDYALPKGFLKAIDSSHLGPWHWNPFFLICRVRPPGTCASVLTALEPVPNPNLRSINLRLKLGRVDKKGGDVFYIFQITQQRLRLRSQRSRSAWKHLNFHLFKENADCNEKFTVTSARDDRVSDLTTALIKSP